MHGSTDPTEDLSIVAPNAARFGPVAADRAQTWAEYPPSGYGPIFPRLVGFHLDDLREDYARLRLPFRAELLQPAGVVHGGVIATMIDSVFVPAIGAGYPERRRYSTVDLSVQYLGAVTSEDLLAEGWITKRGRSIIFCAAEVRSSPSGELVATGTATYKVSSGRME
ncbi:MAG: PaaI family thioesterase [Actinomycetota bacterium]